MTSVRTKSKQTNSPKRPSLVLPTLSTLAFGAVTAAALVVGLLSLRYALPHPPAPAPLPNFVSQRGALVIHAVSASVALLAGPWQFIANLRRRRPGLHRWTGRVYLAAVAVAWVSSVPLALGAVGGTLSTFGFLGLGAAWIGSSGAGLAAILRRQVGVHQDWMTRSYALTTAAITLRLYLVAAMLLHLPFVNAYRAISWLCWVPNLLVAEMIIWLRCRGQQPSSESKLAA